jgi:hypothetical protein
MSFPLILDKSAFQSLSYRELLATGRYFIQNVPPVMVNEVVADLKKQFKDRTPEEEVVRLAQKSGAAGGTIALSHVELLRAELDGRNAVPMTGQIIPDNGRLVPDQHGELVGLIEPSPLDYVILRLAGARVLDTDRSFAERWRAGTKNLSLTALEEFLRRHSIILPRAATPAELQESVDGLLRDTHLLSLWLAWLMGQLRAQPPAVRHIQGRWEAAGAPSLKTFAPYGHHCMRALLMLHGATRFKIIRGKPTDLVDLQYLFYQPFCLVFASNDLVHATIGPLTAQPYQRFLLGRDFKTAVKAVADHLDALSPEERRRASAPPELGNLVNEVWNTLRPA